MKKQFLKAAILFAIAISFMGCSAQATYEPDTYSAVGEIRSIVVDVRDRPICVSPATDDKVTLEYAESTKERYDIQETNGVLAVTLLDGTKNWTDYIGAKAAVEDRIVRIYVPQDCLNSLRIQTTNSTIDVSGIILNDTLFLASNGGDIVMDNLTAGRSMRLEVKNGDIRGTLAGQISDYNITSTIKKGKSNLPVNGGKGPIQLDVTVNNGDVDLDFIEADQVEK